MNIYLYVFVSACVRVYKISKARNDMMACREVVSTLLRAMYRVLVDRIDSRFLRKR